jgi:hypothetical protein
MKVLVAFMVNLKCRKLLLDGKEFMCMAKGKAIPGCDIDCKDFIQSPAMNRLIREVKKYGRTLFI